MAPQVVIAGGGVIGAATAYYLSQRGYRPVVVEACTVACHASGKAGGFLAADWCDGNALGPLARKSFKLHAELAEVLGAQTTGYRRVRTHSLAVKPGAGGKAPLASLPAWVDGGDVASASVIGSEDTTAQVHPALLTRALLAAVEAQGGQVRERTRVEGVELSDAGDAVAGVRLRSTGGGASGSGGGGGQETIPADAVVFATGVWSGELENMLPPGVGLRAATFSGLKVNSMVLADPGGRATADMLFLAYRGKNGALLEPEVYPRPDGTVYVCGVSSEEAPPPLADDIAPLEGAVATLREVAAAVSPALGAAEAVAEQACFLPCTADGLPLIGALPGRVRGMYLATGHSCWGILNAPATGLGMAELIADGAASSVDLRAFDPARCCRR